MSNFFLFSLQLYDLMVMAVKYQVDASEVASFPDSLLIHVCRFV